MSEIPKVIVPPQPLQPPQAATTGFVTAGHGVLFQDHEAHRCDVCASALEESDREVEGDDSRFDVRGRGLLVWSRGEERRYQEPPLCSSCAAAIGLSALQRWEIEEEEG
jgi:hypothetical protein